MAVGRKAFFIHTLAEADRDPYAEQLIFARSPVNVWLTAIGLYAALVLSYAIVAAVTGVAWVARSSEGWALDPRPRLALTLAFLVCCVLAVQRHATIKQCEEAPNLARILKPDVASEIPALPALRIGRATVVGVALGALLAALTIKGLAANPTLFFWYAAMIIALCAMFARGVEFSRSSGRGMAAAIGDGLTIDLLQIDKQYVWGRLSSQIALIWFAVSAASCLLFVTAQITLFSIFILIGCAGMGLWVFIATQRLVHRKIRAAKASELELLRGEIAAVRLAMEHDGAAALKLQGLLAYEARIDAVREWPFDQHIVVRVAASGLLLTAPWFGQAAAAAVVERLGHAAG